MQPEQRAWIIDDFLNTNLFIAMKDTFPNINTESVRATYDLYCGDKEYQLFLNTQASWRQFHAMIFSKKFWEPYFPNINLYNFSASYKEHRSGAMDPKEQRPFLYSRIDIGIATEGYGIHNGGRGLHIDNKQRIISGLLYFTDQRDLQGGEFIFCHPDGRIKQTVPVKENRCILSHQDEDAWTMVNPLRKGIRRFIYFSLNATWPFYKR